MTEVPRVKAMQAFLNPVRSLLLAQKMHAQPNTCFENAWHTFILNPEVFALAHFIEGWLVMELGPVVGVVEHGWIELPDGGIIDPSILLIASFTDPVFYAAGVRRTWEETEALEDQIFPHVRFDGVHGDDGLLHEGYKAARDAASQLVFTRAFAHQPPKMMVFCVAQDLSGQLVPPMVQVSRGLGDDSLDRERSLALAKEIGTQAHSWDIVRSVLFKRPGLFWHPFYIEGWVVHLRADALLLVEQGWIDDRGSVLDPSCSEEWEITGRIEYFPGSRWSWDEMQQGLSTRPLPAIRFLGAAHPSYQDYYTAYQQALARAEELAWKTGLPLVVRPAPHHPFKEEAFWPLPLQHLWEQGTSR